MKGQRTVSLKSLGCRTNHQEVALLRARLVQDGFIIVDDDSNADVIIVNSCCVTQTAETKSRRLVNILKKQSPQSALLVTGCLVQENPGLFSSDKSIRWVVGNAHKNSIPSLLKASGTGVIHSEFPAGKTDFLHIEDVCPDPSGSNLLRFPVKIQEGCDFSCSYCLVPRVRGPSRSAPLSAILDQCRSAVEAGFKELVLSGTHIGQFRNNPGVGFTVLLEKLLRITGDFRIRLSSFDPRDLSPGFIDVISGNPRICQHLHVSVQSLCPDVLKAMGRSHADFDLLIRILGEYRAKNQGHSLGADIIAGYPGETPAQFTDTMLAARSIGFTYAHIFPFSERPGTPAASMTPKIADSEKKERCAALSALFSELNLLFIRSQVGKPHRIIVEDSDPASGVTSNYLHVSLPGFRAPRNEWQSVRISAPCNSGKKNRCTGILQP